MGMARRPSDGAIMTAVLVIMLIVLALLLGPHPAAGKTLIVGEAVADPRLGEDVAGLGRRGLELPAQRVHQHAKVLRLIDGVRAPDRFEDRAVREDAPGVLDE